MSGNGTFENHVSRVRSSCIDKLMGKVESLDTNARRREVGMVLAKQIPRGQDSSQVSAMIEVSQARR